MAANRWFCLSYASSKVIAWGLAIDHRHHFFGVARAGDFARRQRRVKCLQLRRAERDGGDVGVVIFALVARVVAAEIGLPDISSEMSTDPVPSEA